MTDLYLIRHGETVWNADGRFQGHQDTPLNEAGRAQAHIVANALAFRHYDAIYCSDLARAAETAAVIAAHHGIDPIADARLREAHFGAWENLTLAEITARWPETAAAWRKDSLRTRPQGGETLEQVQVRVSEALAEMVAAHPDGHIAVVAHGGSLRAIIATALGADLSIFRRLRLDNCSISHVRIHQGEYVLLHLNDICHLAQQAPRGSWDEAGAVGRVK